MQAALKGEAFLWGQEGTGGTGGTGGMDRTKGQHIKYGDVVIKPFTLYN